MRNTMEKMLALVMALMLVLGTVTVASASGMDADELYERAMAYENGDGVEQSYERAVELYLQAAELGHADAQNELGLLMYNGQGVESDPKGAVKWFQLAAEQNHRIAQNNLGVCYMNGDGVEQSYAKAVELYEKSAEQGYFLAQRNLAKLYENGEGVEQSYEQAAKWYELAAEQGDADSQFQLGWFYANGEGVTKSYEQAAKWYEAAANQGVSMAQNNLGHLYENGNGVEKSYELAIKWYEAALKQGNSYAHYNLGRLYEGGFGVEQDYKRAAELFAKAAKYNVLDAQAHYDYCNSMALASLDPSSWDWGKSYFSNGTMYIYTRNYIPGIMMDSSGQVLGAYLAIAQDKDGFFAYMFDDNGDPIYNESSVGVPVQAELTWYEGTEREYKIDCQTTLAANGNVIRLPFSGWGSLQGTLFGKTDMPKLTLTVSPGRTYLFLVPNDTDYEAIWEVASNFWYIPTYNTDLYTGTDVNPDLVEFLNNFANAFNAELNSYKQANRVDVFVASILAGSTGNRELDFLYSQYKEIEANLLPRRVDYDRFAVVKDSVDTLIAVQGVDTALDIANGILDLFF